MAEGGIGSVSVSVTPDATNFWREFEARTRGDAERVGARQGEDFGRGFRRGAGDLDVRVRADTAALRAEIDRLRAQLDELNARGSRAGQSTQKSFSLLRDSIILLGATAVPVGAVLAGALAGVIPTVATLGLGIAGIRSEMKSGALQGTAYGQSLTTASTELSKLKTVAAGGILDGVSRAIQTSRPLFRVLNSDVGQMSQQLGDIIANAGPGLLAIFDQLNPLFVTFGNLIARGAAGLEHFAQSGTGVSTFVSYVQAELPHVLHLVGSLATLIGHVVQASAGLGGGLLTVINALVTGLNALPIGALQVLIPLIVSMRAAFLSLRAINGIIDSVSSSIDRLGARSAAAATAQRASSLRMQADAEAEAAAFATTRADEAEAAAAAARSIAVSMAAIGSSLAGEAEVAATESEAVALAFRGQAAAAATAAAATAAAADTAAADVAAAGAVARVGWAAVLGPIGALVIGLGILGSAFLGGSHDTDAATSANQAYAASVKQSTDALANANVQATIKSLGDDHALDQLRSLQSLNSGLGISFNDLTNAVNGTDKQFDSVISKLKGIGGTSAADTRSFDFTHGSDSANKLIKTLTTLRGSLGSNLRQQNILNEAMRQYQALADGGNAAAHQQASELGLTGKAYLDAQLAAKSNTEQTKSQTAAFQLENDAASLLQQTLDKLAGRTLGTAQAQTALRQANLAVLKSLHDNGTVIDGGTAKAVANQQAFQQQASSAIAYAEAVGKATGSSKAEVAQLKASRDAIEANLKSRGKLTPALKSYIDGLYDLKNLHVPPTKLDVDTAEGKRKTADLQATLNSLQQNKIPGLTANSAKGHAIAHALGVEINAIKQGHIPVLSVEDQAALQDLITIQNHLDGLHDKTITVNIVGSDSSGASTTGGGTLTPRGRGATRGDVPGNARGNKSVQDGLFTLGERGWELGRKVGNHLEILNHRDAMKATGLPDKLPGYAAGTVDTSGISGAIGNVGSAYSTPINVASTGINRILAQLAKAGDSLNKAIAKGLGSAAASAFRSQIAALAAEAERQLKALKHKIVTTDVSALSAALTQTRTETEAALSSLIADAKHAGASDSAIDKLVGKETTLLSLQKQRNTVAKSITAEQGKLNDLQSKYADIYNSTKQAALGTFDITTAGQSTGGTASLFGDQPGTAAAPTTAGSILASLKVTAGNAAKFHGVLQKLIKSGLNKNLVLQLAQAGPGALAQAQALAAATPAQLKSLNSTYSALDTTSGQIGKLTATDLYGAGISAAEGIIRGLQSRESALNKQMKKLAEKMVNALKEALGIHSPSRVMRGLAHNTVEGYRLGLVDRLEHVAQAGKDLANAGVPGSQQGRWSAWGGGAHQTHVHNYNMQPMDPAAIAVAVDRRVQFGARP